MKNISSLNAEVFKKNKKRNIKILFLGILLLGITILLLYFGIKNKNKKLPELKEMESLIVNKESNEGIYSSIDVVTKPYLFAVYEENGIEENNKFYLVMDKNNHLYIVYMNNTSFEKLNVDTLSENSITIKGITKKIPNSIKELAIESYNEMMDDEYLTKENFETYVGLIYLDTVSPINDSTLYYLGACLFGLFFVIIVTIYLIILIKNKLFFKNIEDNELAHIDAELSQLNNSPYCNMYFFILKKYLVDMYNNIVILNYEDIVWAYPFEQRYNGLLINKYIKIVTKDNKRYEVANTKLLEKKKDEILEEILYKIKEKNKNIIIGYNKENKKKAKNAIKLFKKVKIKRDESHIKY